jgi:hypothetical protein
MTCLGNEPFVNTTEPDYNPARNPNRHRLIKSCWLVSASRRVFLMSTDPHPYNAAAARREEVSVTTSDVGGDSGMTESDIKLYTSRIIKAGALLPDTTTLFNSWDESESVAENLDRLQRENLFGKTSRSRIRDIQSIFRQRYLQDESVTKALVYLVKCRFPKAALDSIFYFHSAQSDRLLHDVVTEVLADFYVRGKTEIRIEDIQRILPQWEGRMTANWSEYTTRRVAQGLLSTLRDFGILQGAKNKRLAPPALAVTAFSYIAFYLHSSQASGERLIHNKAWALFFLSTNEVERLFMEAHQHRLLEYHAAGTVIRINFPSESLEDYARVISERTI